MNPPFLWPSSLLGRNVRVRHAELVAEMDAAIMKNQSRPLDRSSTVTLREITKDTVRAVSLLDVAIVRATRAQP